MDQMHIEQLYEHIISVMTKNGNLMDFSLRLAKLNTNSERTDLVFDLLNDLKVFPKIIVVVKDCLKSDKLRNLGNYFFRKRDDNTALDNYNKAILHAPSDSRELALAFANRSAVLFSHKLYNECLQDIERALLTGYDEDLKPKILKRRLLCNEALLQQTDINKVDILCQRKFKITKEQHPLIPCASKSIKISYSSDMGRSVIATEDIPPGEVLAVEDPYCCILLESYYLKYCYGCLKQCNSMLPCKQCCSVMFCSEECRATSWEKFHRMDCSLMPLLSFMSFTKLELLALRITIQTKCSFTSWKHLQKSVNEIESVNDPQLKGFTKPESSAEGLVFDSKYYASIHTLVTNIEKRSVSDIFQKSVTAAVCLYFLKQYTPFFSEWSDNSSNENEHLMNKEECVSLTGGLLLLHNMTAPCNMHTITGLSGFVNTVNFGGGAYAFLSLINHSCAQNIMLNCSGTKTALVALTPIKKGQQLFDNYGFHHAAIPVMNRKKSLQFQYKFNCACVACVNNWPLYFGLRPAQFTDAKKRDFIARKILTEDIIFKLRNGDRKVALDIVGRLYPYVSLLEENAPNRELADYQEIIKQCWSLFGNIDNLIS